MSFRNRVRDYVIEQTTDVDGAPALSRRATHVCALAADTAADHSTAAAVALSVAGAAAVAAQSALTNFVYPPGQYAGFREEQR